MSCHLDKIGFSEMLQQSQPINAKDPYRQSCARPMSQNAAPDQGLPFALNTEENKKILYH